MKRFVRYAGAFLLLGTLSCMFRQKKKNIIFFGDSITKNATEPDGFITKLRQALAEKIMQVLAPVLKSTISN